MLKKIVEFLIRKIKNKRFSFDEKINLTILASLSFEKLCALIRGLRLILFFVFPTMLFLGRGVRFFNVRKIYFGKGVSIGEYSYLSALGTGGIHLGDGVNIGAFGRIIVSTSFNNVGKYIHLQNNVSVGEYSYLGGAGGLEIGADTIIGQYFSGHPENHNFHDSSKLIREQGVTRKGIKIGKNCWVGAKVTVLDGVEIGDNCVVAAGAVVAKSFGSNLLIGGVPAIMIKELSMGESYD